MEDDIGGGEQGLEGDQFAPRVDWIGPQLEPLVFRIEQNRSIDIFEIRFTRFDPIRFHAGYLVESDF